MSMYVKIELADERYCDGCPLLHEEQCVLARHFPAPCQAEGGALGWIRPQACIEASRDIEYTLESYDIEMGYHKAR